MKQKWTCAIALAGAGVLASAAGAWAHRPDNAGGPVQQHGQEGLSHDHSGDHARRNGHIRPVAFVFKGTVSTVDQAAGTITVDVSRGNHWANKDEFVPATVTFDVSKARLSVADTDATLGPDAGDFKQGDRVVVLAKLPRNSVFAQNGPSVPAKHVADQTNPPAEASTASG